MCRPNSSDLDGPPLYYLHILLIVADIVPHLITYCRLKKIASAKTFGVQVDIISDDVPVHLAINYTDSIASSNIVNEQSSIPKP